MEHLELDPADLWCLFFKRNLDQLPEKLCPLAIVS